MKRSTWILRLRALHGWLGLWGALLGVIFGVSGIWLNHRSVMKLPAPSQQIEQSSLDLPAHLPDSAETLALWLGPQLGYAAPVQIRQESARPVPWQSASGSIQEQPEHWSYIYGNPMHLVQADYWRGAPRVQIRRIDAGFLASLRNLHLGSGAGTVWILLVDSLAGSIITLSITGVVLWCLTHKRRATGYLLLAGSSLLMLCGSGLI